MQAERMSTDGDIVDHLSGKVNTSGMSSEDEDAMQWLIK